MHIRGWASAEVRETHISRVYLAQDRVLKVKKAVCLGFLDFSTPERQRAACEAEQQLNDRTAPGVTLGLRAVTRTGVEDEFELDGPGPVEGWAVEMMRLPDDARMGSWLDAGSLTLDDVDRVAAWLAGFHAGAHKRRDLGGAAWVGQLVEDNFAQLPEADSLLGPSRARAARAWQREALPSQEIERRREEGFVRDGHGDLRLDHVYLFDDRVLAIDGIEFDARYRCLDVTADVAFLVMELRLHDRQDLAERFAARWARDTGDWASYRLLDGYTAYRAWVRAKVRALQGQPDEARRRLEVAHVLGDQRSPPRIVAVGGPIAAGKSTVADTLARSMVAPVIDADRTRKQGAGAGVEDRLGTTPFAGAYSEDATRVVYQRLAEHAEVVLRSGRSVILDASFRSEDLRQPLRELARRMGVPLRFVTCTAPREELERRLRGRDTAPGVVSDARAPLLASFLARYAPPAGPDVCSVDTDRPLDIGALRRFIED